MFIPAGQKLKYLVHPSGSLVKLGSEFEGLPLPESGYFDVKNQVPFEPLIVSSEKLEFDRDIKVDDSAVVVSSTGEVFFKYNGFIN